MRRSDPNQISKVKKNWSWMKAIRLKKKDQAELIEKRKYIEVGPHCICMLKILRIIWVLEYARYDKAKLAMKNPSCYTSSQSVAGLVLKSAIELQFKSVIGLASKSVVRKMFKLAIQQPIQYLNQTIASLLFYLTLQMAIKLNQQASGWRIL